MIVYFVLILAGVCESVYHTLRDHYYQSVFKNLDPSFWWSGGGTWQNKYEAKGGLGLFLKRHVITFITDADHLFVFLRNIFVLSGATLAFAIDRPFAIYWHTGLGQIIDFILNIGCFWAAYSGGFTVFYNFIWIGSKK